MNNSEVTQGAYPHDPESKALTFSFPLQSARLSTDSDSTNNNMEVIFLGQSTNSTHNNNSGYTHDNSVDSGLSSCRTLQRKLELKVERARRSYSHNQQEIRMVSAVSPHPKLIWPRMTRRQQETKSAQLIPIDRLQIPGHHENVPLVEYKTEHSSDEDEILSPFFPAKAKQTKRLDLSDTFSLQEMTIESESDTDSNDSQNLELLSPGVRVHFLDRLCNYLCCSKSRLWEWKNEIAAFGLVLIFIIHFESTWRTSFHVHFSPVFIFEEAGNAKTVSKFPLGMNDNKRHIRKNEKKMISLLYLLFRFYSLLFFYFTECDLKILFSVDSL